MEGMSLGSVDARSLRNRIILGMVLSSVTIYAARKTLQSKHNIKKESSKTKRTGSGVGVNVQFVSQLKRILPICVPGFLSREAGLLASLAAILVARTWLDIWFSAFNGVVVRSIVTRDEKLFWRNAVIRFALMMWPLSIVNNSLKLNINMLALSFRTRLTLYAQEEYLKSITFYKVANLDNRVQNADQLLTQDIDKFSDSLTHLYSDIAKPLVDIGLFAVKLGQSIGGTAPLMMLGYFATSGLFLRLISPSFGRYAAQEQMLEGQLRYNHSRIIAHSEEIAFYRGGHREMQIVNGTFNKIRRHLHRLFFLRFANGIVDSILVKYCATQLAYVILSRPAFEGKPMMQDKAAGIQQMVQSNAALAGSITHNGTVDDTGAERSGENDVSGATRIMEDYSTNSGYLINLSQAVGRLVLAGRDLTRFAGYTHRVSEFLDVLQDINHGRYQRTMVSTDPNGSSEMRMVDQNTLAGRVEWKEGVIQFTDVPICTPNGDVLVKSLTLRLTRGMHCLITGPNGCGKSSLFRILGGLWPIFGGVMVKPSPKNMFYVPQKPYLPLGTLRDQLIYPHTVGEAFTRGFDDSRLFHLLEKVNLAYLVDRSSAGKSASSSSGSVSKIDNNEHEMKNGLKAKDDGTSDHFNEEVSGWDVVCDWTDVLSGGEKQRVAMARLFYHQPQFAILDECTSAVSLDVEGAMYRYAQDLDITLFTISHRPSLVPYHQYLLKFDGEGGYSFGPLQNGSSLTHTPPSHVFNFRQDLPGDVFGGKKTASPSLKGEKRSSNNLAWGSNNNNKFRSNGKGSTIISPSNLNGNLTEAETFSGEKESKVLLDAVGQVVEEVGPSGIGQKVMDEIVIGSTPPTFINSTFDQRRLSNGSQHSNRSIHGSVLLSSGPTRGKSLTSGGGKMKGGGYFSTASLSDEDENDKLTSSDEDDDYS